MVSRFSEQVNSAVGFHAGSVFICGALPLACPVLGMTGSMT